MRSLAYRKDQAEDRIIRHGDKVEDLDKIITEYEKRINKSKCRSATYRKCWMQ